MDDLIQPLAKHIIFPLWAKYDRNSMPRHLAALNRSQYFSPEVLRDLQVQRLKTLLAHAYANCPFYTRRFDEAGFNVDSFQAPEDILQLPVLTKEDIQAHAEQMKATNLPADEIVPDKTGGSTGRPLHFFMDRDRVFSRNASALRHDSWTGWDIGHKSAYLWGHRGDLAESQGWKQRLRSWLLDRRLVLDTSSITGPRMEQFRVDLLNFKPKIIVGYANAVYLFARYLKETGKRDFHRPVGIVSSAEVLDPQQRDVIEAVFECKVFDRYGSRETSILASECEHHTGLHICAENIYLEVISGGQPAPPGQIGRIVITDLLNFGMPFIRYQIEDVGKLSETTDCPCGRGLPLMDMAAGRDTDFLLAEDGTIVSGASLTIYLIANAPGIAQAQLVQEKRGEIIFRLVKDESFGDDSLKFLEDQFPRFFGQGMTYTIEYLDSIPVEASGKYRFSICKLDPAELF